MADDPSRIDYETSDFLAVSLYYLCVIVCFALSAVFHTFSDHSLGLCLFSNKLDHLGIVFVMWGSGLSCAHFALRCASSTVRVLHFSSISLTAGSCACITLRPDFRRPDCRIGRLLTYCFLGASLFLPLLQAWLALKSLNKLDRIAGLWSFLGLATVNFAGGALYVARVPERWLPGKLDLLGHSHNWMHILVILGAHIRLQGLLGLYQRWEVDASMHCQNGPS